MYEPVIGRWHCVDNKAELYFGRSPYIYALNNPINAIDPDGNIVIFINGNHFGDGAKGFQGYAGNSYGSALSGNYNWRGTSDYWSNSGFDGVVMDQLGDHNAIYRDGAIGGYFGLLNAGALRASVQELHGYGQGMIDAKRIIESLARDDAGNIVESIKIITHSMGGAYGKGFVGALKEYIKTLPEDQQKQIMISLVADFDPFQAGDIEADPNIKTMQFKHAGKNNFWGMGWLANEDEQGLNQEDIYTNTGPSTDHFITTFFDDISKLEEGTYKWDGTQWVKQ